MKKQLFYVAPAMETIEVWLENGIAQSHGDAGRAGDVLLDEDVTDFN